MGNPVMWIEIPVTDMDRAAAFYGAVLRREIELVTNGDERFGFLGPPQPEVEEVDGIEDDADGPLVFLYAGEDGTNFPDRDLDLEGLPKARSCLVYFDAGPDMDAFLDRVSAEGGRVTRPKFRIGEDEEAAVLAYFLDSEGNPMGAHAPD